MKRSLSDVAYHAIREQILRGRLELGAPLSRRQLATQLGMSLIPVTEALQRLESDGLVESRPRAGTRVRVPSERDIRESYAVREALESQSVRMFTAGASSEAKRELARKAERVDELFKRLADGAPDPEFQYLVHSEHAQFHLFIAECADCQQLLALIEKNQVLIRNWVYDVASHRRALPLNFHRELGEALISGDVLVADQKIRDHVNFGLEDTLQNMHVQAAADWRLPRNAGAAGQG